jgi:8-oxo-dGTP pyrophosphatase MutT (NUDIX family)
MWQEKMPVLGDFLSKIDVRFSHQSDFSLSFKPELKSLPVLGRNPNVCPFDCLYGHSLRKCPQFNEFKSQCTKIPYIDRELKQTDLKGFCAGGVCVYFKTGNTFKILFLSEHRRDIKGYNFPGGGRETILTEKDVLRPETYLETISKEFEEELTEIVELSSIPTISKICDTIRSHDGKIYWSGITKYILLPVKIKLKDAKKLKLLEEVPDSCEALHFKWISLDELQFHTFHEFTKSFLFDVQKYKEVFFE